MLSLKCIVTTILILRIVTLILHNIGNNMYRDTTNVEPEMYDYTSNN